MNKNKWEETNYCISALYLELKREILKIQITQKYLRNFNYLHVKTIIKLTMFGMFI